MFLHQTSLRVSADCFLVVGSVFLAHCFVFALQQKIHRGQIVGLALVIGWCSSLVWFGQVQFQKFVAVRVMQG